MHVTVGQKMHQTLYQIESAAASLKSFSADTQNKAVQQQFRDSAQQLTNIANSLRQRVNEIEAQEPQYKMQ